jgi:Uma2 family endonuclease
VRRFVNAGGNGLEGAIVVDAPPRRKLTFDEYQQMGELGILHEDERIELLDGELYEMTPIGDDHIGDVNSLNFIFSQRLGSRALVSVQNPIRLSDFSAPQPDVTVLRWRDDFYRKGTARPEDVLLLVEVARSSLDYDRRTKLPRYAAAGIGEVWIVNLVDEQIEVYRSPVRDQYTLRSIHRRGETVSPLGFPDVTIRVEEVLG